MGQRRFIKVICKNHSGSRPFFEEGEFKTVIDLDRIIMIQEQDWPQNKCVHIMIKTSEVSVKTLYSMEPYDVIINEINSDYSSL